MEEEELNKRELELTDDEKEEIRLAFAVYDPENYGEIKYKEFRMVLDSLGVCPTEADFYQMCDELDPEGTKRIRLPHLYRLLGRHFRGTKNMDALKAAFEIFDRDGDKIISKAELRSVMASMGDNTNDKDFDEYFEAIDGDGDGKITWDEYLRLIS